MLSLAAAAKKGKVPGGDRPARKPKTKGLGQLLADKAQSLEDGKKSRRKSGPTGGLLSGDDDAPSRSKRRRRDRSESFDGSSGSEKDFRVASSREVDLMALSQRDPGCLLRSALREMKKYLAARGEANKEDLTAGRVGSYLHQILLPQYPKAVGDPSHGVGYAPRGRSRSPRGLVAPKVQGHRSQPVSRRELVGGEAPRADPHPRFVERKGRNDGSGKGGTTGLKTSSAAQQGGEERLGNRRRGRQVLSSRDASYQAEEGLVEEASRQSSSRKSEFREVPRKVSLREGGPTSYDQGGSPQRSPRSKGGSKGGSEEREGLGAESPVSGSWDTESQRGSDVTVEESEPEREVEGEREKFLSKFSEFCSGLDLQGRSMSQMSVLLVQVLHRSPGIVGFYAEKAARAASSQQGTGEVWKDVLPLSVPTKVAEFVMEIWRNDGFEVKKAGRTGATVQHLYREVGISCLQFCMIVGLNLMWSGLRSGARIHGGPVRRSQEDALSHLRRAAEYVIDGKEAPPLKGVPRTPKESWDKLVDEARISYHGEVVLPSLPPEGFGGIAEELVLDPRLCQLDEKDLPDVIPAPKVRVKDGDWEPLAKALFERGILSPVDQVIGLRGKSVLNGLFGVQKAGRDLPDGRPAQRLIMDLRATNAVLKIIAGDIGTLAGASAFTSVVIEDGKVITISGDDLVSSFYLFKMPPAWLPYLAFERSITWRALGIEKDGATFLSAAVLPMGFSSSVGLMQHVHRRLALWGSPCGAELQKALGIRKDRVWPFLGEDSPVWVLYLDDSTFLNVLEGEVAKQLMGKPPKEQDMMRKAYQFWGVPFNTKKATEQVLSTERLGGFLDGEVGRVGVTTKRLLENLSLGLWLLGRRRTSRKSLQVFAGKEVHVLQFRRPLFAIYDKIWKLIAGASDMPWLNEDVVDEIVVGLSLLPLRFTDWRADLDPHVMASDASETGGGFVIAKRLTSERDQASSCSTSFQALVACFGPWKGPVLSGSTMW